MEAQFVVLGYKRMYRQRNCLLGCVLFLLLANVGLSLTVFVQKKDLIVVPYATGSFEIGAKPDESYVAQMVDLHLNDLLNISPSNVEQKKARILKYTDSGSWGNINRYFDDLTTTFLKFEVTTSFVAKNIEMNLGDLSVLVRGTFIAKWGAEGNKEEEKTYLFRYKWQYGVLLLQEFLSVEPNQEEK